MKTNKQRELLYKAVNRKRDSDINQHRKTVAAALNGSIEPLLKRIDQSGAFNESNLRLISEAPLRFAMRQIYTTTGYRFAQATEKKLRKVGTKDLGLTTFEFAIQSLLNDMTEGGLGMLISQMTDYTRKQIAGDINNFIMNGASIGDMAGLLRTKYKDVNRMRGLRIARTETIKASNYGALQGAQASGVPFIKEWNSILDDRTREGHRRADGKQALDGKPFIINGAKLLYPADSSLGAPAKEVVNCRCVIDFVDPEDYEAGLDSNLGGNQNT